MDDMANDTPPKLCLHHIIILRALPASTVVNTSCINYVERSKIITVPSTGDVFNRLQSP